MPESITHEVFIRYVRGEASEAEAAHVRAWLAQPANQLVAQHWMRLHWEEADVAPATALPPADEPDYAALLTTLHECLGLPLVATTTTGFPAWRRWVAAAAVVAGLASGGWWWQAHSVAQLLPMREVATRFGQTQRVLLPDGSRVLLNSHSTLRYGNLTAHGQPREVWLDGEGYFEVQHTTDNRRFVVHTTAGFNVEVLGTKFTVYRRHAQARVVLLSGKVRVDFADSRQADVLMTPGELVETTDSVRTWVVHKPVRTATYSSWKDNRLVLDDTSIAELVIRLRDTYGVDVVVDSPDLNNRRITGTVPIQDLDVLLQALTESFHLRVERREGRIILSDFTSQNSPKPVYD